LQRAQLTTKELGIVRCMLREFATYTICMAYDIDSEEVERHLAHVRAKIGVRTHDEMLRWFLKEPTATELAAAPVRQGSRGGGMLNVAPARPPIVRASGIKGAHMTETVWGFVWNPPKK
jgi:DNA-binding CsgD family transcriptional regulator